MPPSDRLAEWLRGQRWFAAKTHRIEHVAIDAVLPLASSALTIVAVTLDSGRVDRYVTALPPNARAAAAPPMADAFDDPVFARALLDVVADGRRVTGESAWLEADRTGAFPAPLPFELPVHRIGGEQSNTSIVFGDVAIMKIFRRLAEGLNPEAEITRVLTERRFPHTPRLYGQLDYRPRGGGAATLAVVQELIPGARDGWQWLLAELGGGGRALDAIHRLGEVTGELHQALAASTDDPAFTPETITDADLAAWDAAVQAQLDQARAALGDASAVPIARDLAEALSGLRGRQKIRHHGDLHFGQTLRRLDGDWVIIDFEGEPLRPLAERRCKHTPLRDVAGILRSLDYAAVSAAPPGGEAWAQAWEREAAEAFIAGYRRTTADAPFLPTNDAAFQRALAVFELEKAAYEVVYEANNRPDWIAIPRRGLLSASSRLTPRRVGAA